MKRVVRAHLAVALLSLASGSSWALSGGEGLAQTPHDFTPTGTGDLKVTTSGTVGLCTFCHTPHKASATTLLWNHTLSGNSFSWQEATTTAGTTLPTLSPTYRGASVKCLSCHDGSVAVGDVGWFAEAPHTGASAMLGPITNPTFITATGTAAGNMGSAAAVTNLSGNHPVGIPYPLKQVANTYNGITSGSALVMTAYQADPTALTSANIRLYQDDGAGNMTATPAAYSGTSAGIECSSCHDPHNKQSIDDLFLRGKMVGSAQADGYICLQCHLN
jgi:Doubled CXXCH motif (Paired_CXXCH_1)